MTFDNGPARDVDLVVAADGIRSSTRSLVFGSEARIHPLGLYTAYFTIPRGSTDGDWARWYNASGGLTVTLRPDNVGTTRALLSFLSRPRGYEDLNTDEQKDLLQAKFADAGWEAPRALAALGESPDFYFELTGQVHAPPVDTRPDRPSRRRGLLPLTDQWDGYQPGSRRGLRPRW